MAKENPRPDSNALSSLIHDAIKDLAPGTENQIMMLVARYGDARWWDGYRECKNQVKYQAGRHIESLQETIENI